MFLISRKFHSGWGISGTEVTGTAMEQKAEQGRGWEWYVAAPSTQRRMGFDETNPWYHEGGRLSFGNYSGLGSLLPSFYGALGTCVTPKVGERRPLLAACPGKETRLIVISPNHLQNCANCDIVFMPPQCGSLRSMFPAWLLSTITLSLRNGRYATGLADMSYS